MNLDLAAIAPPDHDMPPGFVLTNGAYIPVDLVASTQAGHARIDSIVRTYEATYELTQGAEFMEVQILQFPDGEAPDLRLSIANWTIERMVTRADAVADHVRLDDPRPAMVVAGRSLGTQDDLDAAFPVCSVAIACGCLSVRVIWHGTDPVSDLILRAHVLQTIRAAQTALARADNLLAYQSIPGIDPSLPDLVPRFSPPSNFENYLHRSGRYATTTRQADGFVSAYRRGITEPWVERGKRRRLIACDLLRFADSSAAAAALADPRTLVDDWMLENGFIPMAQDLDGSRMFAFQHTSGFWTCTIFAHVRDLLLTSDVWGYSTMADAEAVATNQLRLVRDAAERETLPVTLGPDFTAGT